LLKRLISLYQVLYFYYIGFTLNKRRGNPSLHRKKNIDLKTTNLEGKIVKRRDVTIESFGKSFLLPFDVILGLIFTNEKGQILFGRLGNTFVIKIKTKEDFQVDANRRHIKD
jgi:hypothetical protein